MGKNPDDGSRKAIAADQQLAPLSYAWYRHRSGFSADPWWKNKSLFAALEEKREDSRRKESTTSVKADPSNAPTPTIPKNFDLPAAFFWETLRRHPDGRRLRATWRRFRTSDRHREFREDSLVRKFKIECGPLVAAALDDFCFGWKLSYPELLKGPSIPSGWLQGYASLWEQVCEAGVGPLPIPWRMADGSRKLLHGAACVNLVTPRQPVGASDLVRPFRGKFEEEVTHEFGLTAFASPVDEEGKPLEDLELVPLHREDSHNGPQDEGEIDRSELPPHRLSEIVGHVDLVVHWQKLEETLKPYGLAPMLIAVNTAAPQKLLDSEFRASLEERFVEAKRPSKKPSLNSFGKIHALDTAPIKGRQVSKPVIREFNASASLEPSRLVALIESFR